MKDIKLLYETAKKSKLHNDITAYREAVNELLESKPLDFLSSLKYIITSDIGCTRLDPFVEKYGCSIVAYQPIVECLTDCIDKCKKQNIDSSIYRDYLEKFELFKKKYNHCFDMFDYYSEGSLDRSKYLEAYYSSNKDGIQNSKLIVGMIKEFGEAAIADALITANMIDDKAVGQVMEYVDSISDSRLLSQWMCECSNDVNTNHTRSQNSLSIFESRNLNNYIESMRNNHQSYMRESIIIGDNDISLEYTDEDISMLQDMISFKEYQIVCSESTEERERLQKEVYNLYEEFSGLEELDNKDSNSKPLQEDMSWRNTRNKKTGKAPSYISTNHNIGYGEDNEDDDKKSLDSFKRKSVSNSDKNNDVNTSDDDLDDDPEVGAKITPEDKRSVSNNYYYYTYNNSLNKTSGSYNSKDDHSTDNSVDNSKTSTSDDHSTGKHINSHNGNTDDNSNNKGDNRDNKPHSESFDPLKLNIFGDKKPDDFFTESPYNNEYEIYVDCCEATKSIITGSFMESSDNPKFKYAYKAAYDFNTGHAIKITYSLDPITITNVGITKPWRDEILSIVNKTADVANEKNIFRAILTAVNGLIKAKHNIEIRKSVLTEILNKYIDTLGYVDFQAKDCRIISITDRYTHERLKGPIDIVGVYAAADLNDNRSLALTPYILKRMQDRVRRKGSNFKISTISVGDIQEIPTFMSTFWDKHCDKGLINQNGDVILDDDMDRDNLSQIISSREIHGFDLDSKNSRFSDGLGDFVDPIRSIADSNKNKMFDKYKYNDSVKYIGNAEDLLITANHVKKQLSKLSADGDISEISIIDDIINSLETKINNAEEALKNNNHEEVFNLLNVPKTINEQKEELISLVNQISSKYEINVKVESSYNEAVGDADDNKPESDHPVRDALMDIDRKKTQSQQKMKKHVQDAQNVVRAVKKPIDRTKDWVTNMVNDWKDKDENEIKEKMADPKARKNIFTAIGTAIKAGSLLKAGILLNPVFLSLSAFKKINNDKNKLRIRDEMIGELKTEIKVIDEKISDARAAGDNKEKYQLMRLKNEIEKKLVRVGGSVSNKKWIKGDII